MDFGAGGQGLWNGCLEDVRGLEVGEEKLVGEVIKHRKSNVQTVWSHSVRDDSMYEHPTIEIQ